MFKYSKLIIAFCISLVGLQLMAQEPIKLSLEKAKEYAIQHNYDLRNAQLDIEAAKYRVKESTALGLPQANGSIGYTDNIGLPVQLIPGDFFGSTEDVEVQFGTKYSGSLGATVEQLLFSGSYIVGLKAAKTYLKQSEKSLIKSTNEVSQTVSQSYFMVLATLEAIKVIDSTLVITQTLADQTRLIYENGFAEETELDQLELLISDLDVSRANAVSEYGDMVAILKFHLGLDEKQEIELTETLEESTGNLNADRLFGREFNLNNNIDFRILKDQQEMALLQIQLEKSAYMPTLSANLYMQTQAQRDEWDFFSPEGKWYTSAAFGVNMAIPIFSSGQRLSKVKQAEIRLDKTKVNEEMVSTSLSLKYQTYRKDFENAIKTLQNTKYNKTIAEKIFRRTGVKYSEGLASSLDLLNTHNQYLSSQSAYINAALNMLNKSVQLETLLAGNE